MTTRRRPPFWKRKYLINPRVQLEIIGYLLLFSTVTLVALYIGLSGTLSSVETEIGRIYPQSAEVLSLLGTLRKELVSEFFILFSIVSLTLAVCGGILISHRVAGPAFRIKRILTQLIEGRKPETLDCRRTDFFREIFPLLKKLSDKQGHSTSEEGLTILELMVVVAMVGILSSIAITRYEAFVANARRAEAKIMMSAIYTTEQGFAAAHSSYTGCLRQAGFEPMAGSKRYYGGGFNNFGNTCGPTGDRRCDMYSFHGAGRTCNSSTGMLAVGSPLNTSDSAYAPTVQSFPGAVVATPQLLSISAISQNTFTAVIGGSIDSGSPKLDVWSVDEDKLFLHLYTSP